MADTPSKKKTILVTGGAGFIGSHLCERLVALGHKVISLDVYFTGSSENHMPGVEYRKGHTKDIEKLVPESPDIVYHLGEYSRCEQSFDDIENVWNLNKTGTFAVLEFCRKRKSKIVYTGSSTKFSTDGLGRELSPYAWAKASNIDLVQNYGRWFNVPYAITYFYNVYGPREINRGPYATVIAIFKEEYKHGQPLTVTLPGTQTRNFTHVHDIVSGLVLVGEGGEGDDYSIGNDEPHAIIDVAKLFGGEVVMLPNRPGNRQGSTIDTSKIKALGWKLTVSLEDQIKEFVDKTKRGKPADKRVLIFSTTFYPIMGPAEEALCRLMEATPDIQYDVITTVYSKEARSATCPVPNATVYRVGWGTRFDKYFLPFLGVSIARKLSKKTSYLFSWSLMASYGALTAALFKYIHSLPLLVVVADQRASRTRWLKKTILRFVISRADQIYFSSPEQERIFTTAAGGEISARSIGEGDVLANQLRFTYSGFLNENKKL